MKLPQSNNVPDLPETILVDDGPDASDNFSTRTAALSPPTVAALGPRIWQPWTLRSLEHGCYFLQWKPLNTHWYRFNGAMRVERHGQGVTASGDLYYHQAYSYRFFPSFGFVPNPDPSPSAGIPVFRRAGRNGATSAHSRSVRSLAYQRPFRAYSWRVVSFQGMYISV